MVAKLYKRVPEKAKKSKSPTTRRQKVGGIRAEQKSTGIVVKTGKTYKTLDSYMNIPITDKQKRRR
tara:strand:+ start:1138 stop:1335 length:198 start_codon:yes stop_codon:yes gene_type:complete